MAAYINHAQMASDTYNKIEKEHILKTEIDSKIMTTFSHGIDLSGYDYLTHNTKTQEFLLNFFNEIKTGKQIENASIMAMLYGHICHYFLDTIIHPYVYYIERGTKQVGGQFISGHLLVESYLSSYIVKKRLNKEIMDVPIGNYFTLLPKECKEMLNAIYLQTYQKQNIAKNYQKFIKIILFCENVLKNTPLKDQTLCETVVRFRKYLEENQLTLEEIANENHQIWLHPVTGEQFSTSVLDLYFESIEKAAEAIEQVNNYLYGNRSLDFVKNYFPNISYDTGINLENDQEMRFCRKK